MDLSWQEITEMPLDQGEEFSLIPLTQMAVELKKTPAEALCRLMAKEFLRRKGGGEFFCEGDR